MKNVRVREREEEKERERGGGERDGERAKRCLIIRKGERQWYVL